MPIRIFLVEPCRFFADALARILGRQGNLVLVGTGGCLDEASAWIESGEVDVLLFGAGGDLTPAVREVTTGQPQVKVVVLGVGDCPDDIVRLIEAGAGGYVLKDALLDDLLQVIAAVHAGETRCSPRVAARLFKRLSELAQALGQTAGGPRESLSTREQEILEMIAAGLANKEIARKLDLALCTVKNHVHSILEKLQVSHRREASRYAHSIRFLGSPEGTRPFQHPALAARGAGPPLAAAQVEAEPATPNR
jgi:two-component system, NarL family, nitrate/nitrite response regulator NarL